MNYTGVVSRLVAAWHAIDPNRHAFLAELPMNSSTPGRRALGRFC